MLKSRHPFRREAFGGLLYDRRSEAVHLLNQTSFSLLAYLDRFGLPNPVPAEIQTSVKRLQDAGLLEESLAGQPRLRGRLTHEKQGLLAGPTIVEIYPNFTCNELCTFCYVGEHVENARAQDQLPSEHLPLLADKLLDAGVFNATILGGEPFLYPSLDALLEELAHRGIDTSLSTNGTVKNRHLLDTVKSHRVKLNVALHGPDAATHNKITRSTSFPKVLDFLEDAASHGIEAHLTTVLHPLNSGMIEDTVRTAAKAGVRAMTVSYPQPASYARKNRALVSFSEYKSSLRRAMEAGRAAGVEVQGSSHYNFLLKEYASGFNAQNASARLLYGDKAGRSRLEMMPSGDLYPSSAMFCMPEFKIGNLFEDDLLDVWVNSPVLDRIRNRILPPDCQECDHERICGGGIIGENLASNRWDVPPEDCPVLDSDDSDDQRTSLSR